MIVGLKILVYILHTHVLICTVLLVINIIKMSVCAGYLSVHCTVHEWLLTGYAGPWNML